MGGCARCDTVTGCGDVASGSANLSLGAVPHASKLPVPPSRQLVLLSHTLLPRHSPPPGHAQCIRDGKSIIIEGLHIDPGLFLRECGSPRGDPKLPAEAAAGGLELAGSRGASTGDAAGGGAGGGDVAVAALGSQLQGMQVRGATCVLFLGSLHAGPLPGHAVSSPPAVARLARAGCCRGRRHPCIAGGSRKR